MHAARVVGQARLDRRDAAAAGQLERGPRLLEQVATRVGVRRAAPQLDERRRVARAERVAPRHRHQLLLVAGRQLRQPSKGSGAEQAQRQIAQQVRAQGAIERQPPAHPALVAFEQRRDVDLIEAVGVGEIADEAALLEQHQAALAVAQVHLGLHLDGAELDDLDEDAVEAEPHRREPPDEAVDEHQHAVLRGGDERADLPLAAKGRDLLEDRRLRQLAQTAQRQIEGRGGYAAKLHPTSAPQFLEDKEARRPSAGDYVPTSVSPPPCRPGGWSGESRGAIRRSVSDCEPSTRCRADSRCRTAT